MKLTRVFFPMLGLLVATSLMPGCSGCNSADTAASAAGTENADGANVDADGNAHDGANGTGHDGHDHAAGEGHGDGTAAGDGSGAVVTDSWNRTYATPAEERTGTVDNLKGLRATLVAELDGVRGRLKDGTRTAEERKTDTTRAAELAQGLERLDRAIKVIDEADDVSWATIRESSIKEAGEVRAWMSKYGMNVGV